MNVAVSRHSGTRGPQTRAPGTGHRLTVIARLNPLRRAATATTRVDLASETYAATQSRSPWNPAAGRYSRAPSLGRMRWAWLHDPSWSVILHATRGSYRFGDLACDQQTPTRPRRETARVVTIPERLAPRLSQAIGLGVRKLAPPSVETAWRITGLPLRTAFQTTSTVPSGLSTSCASSSSPSKRAAVDRSSTIGADYVCPGSSATENRSWWRP